MKKIFYIILIGCVWSFLYSCSSDPVEVVDDTDTNSAVVEITTEILTRATVVKSFVEGDEMNIFAKSFNKIDAPDLIPEIKGIFNGTKWNTTPPVTLKEGERTFIYAYSPYEKQ